MATTSTPSRDQFAGLRDPVATGNCPTCQQPRQPLPGKNYWPPQAYADPFCSTVCCRAWYGVGISGPPSGRNMKIK